MTKPSKLYASLLANPSQIIAFRRRLRTEAAEGQPPDL